MNLKESPFCCDPSPGKAPDYTTILLVNSPLSNGVIYTDDHISCVQAIIPEQPFSFNQRQSPSSYPFLFINIKSTHVYNGNAQICLLHHSKSVSLKQKVSVVRLTYL